VTNLAEVHLQLTYTPTATLEVVDAFTNTPDIEVVPGTIFNNPSFTIIENKVNPATGVITFRAKQQGSVPLFNGDGSLIEIIWRRNLPGIETVTLNQSQTQLLEPNGQIIPVTVPDNSTAINQGFVIQGQVTLQGRTQLGGAIVDTTSQKVQTDATGQFEVGVSKNYLLAITAPGYLTTQVVGQLVGSPADIVTIGQISLLAGDVTGDNRIDILDLAMMSRYYGGHNVEADINADGVVNMLDLALAASNYNHQGPLIERR
jgi:hypothetical protein